MKPWAEFYDSLLPDVPGCTPAMANVALRHASREFCERTLAWSVWLDPQGTNAVSPEYDFEIDQTQEVVKLLAATLDGIPVTVLSVNDLPANWRERPCGARGVFTEDRRAFTVLPQPAAGLKLRTRVALKPSMTSAGVEEAFFAQFVEDICAGAKARLMASPKKPYSDPTLSGMHRGTFDRRCDQVAVQVAKSFSRAPRRTKPNFF